MDNSLDRYKQSIKEVLETYATLSHEDLMVELVFDDERLRYLALWVGWSDYRRIHHCAIHIEIIGDRIVIQCNDTEEAIVTELLKRGIPEDNVILGFIHPQHQRGTTEESAA